MEDGFLVIIKQPEVVWFFIGLVLMIGEFAVPGLIIVFFGLGCWITSISLMLFPQLTLTFQLFIFLLASILLLVLLRNKAKNWIGASNDKSGTSELLEEYIGKKAISESDFNAVGEGKIVFKGTSWEAESAFELKKGDPVRIVAKESIKLIVEPINTDS